MPECSNFLLIVSLRVGLGGTGWLAQSAGREEAHCWSCANADEH